MTRPLHVPLFVIALAAAALCGCTLPGGLPFEEHQRVVRPSEHEGTVRRVLVEGPRITASSNATIDVELAAGSVRIVRDRHLHAPVIEVRRHSDDPSRDGGRGEDELVRAGTVVEAGRMVLRVRPQIGALREGERFTLTIRTPSCGQALVRNGGGDVEIVGCGGEIAVSSGEMGGRGGSIRIRTEDGVSGPVYLSTTSGDIKLFAGADSAGRIELMTDSGEVRIAARESRLHGHHVPQRFTGVINDGRNDIIARTSRGDIDVRFADYSWEHPQVGFGGRRGTR